MISAIAAAASSRRQILVPLQLFDQRGEHHSSRKFRRICRPSPVRTDSGWNCTPCTGQRAMPQAHDRAVLGARRDLELVGQRLGDDQRVIAAGDERLRHAAEDAAAVVLDRRRLAVHRRRRAHDLAAERDADGLMPEADAEHRRRRPEPPDHVDRDAGVLGPPGPGRDHDALGLQRLDLVERDLVVALTTGAAPSSPEVLGEVEGERVVVVDEQAASQSPACAIVERLQQRPRLVARFLVLRRRVRVGDDAGAGLDAGACRCEW